MRWFRLFLWLLLFATFFDNATIAHERRSAVVEAVAKAGPAVVNIRTEQIVQRRSTPAFGFGDSFFDDFFRRFSTPRIYTTQALGSGVIIDRRGLLLTNAHVVEKASKIYVALLGETREREGRLVGIDPASDLAVIQIETDRALPSLVLGRSAELMLGETVIAIGNPLGLANSVTTGVVSAPHRLLSLDEAGPALFIQTDALINPGNSGGPLINVDGELIGINTAIARQAQGIGFAIPVEVAHRIADDLVAHGRVMPVYTGILPGEISRTMARSRGAGGVLVTEVDDGSPAARAGLHVADVILAVDGVKVDSADEYLSLIRTYRAGSQVRLDLLRGVEPLQVDMQTAVLPPGYAASYLERIFGLSVIEQQGVVMIDDVLPGSPAAGIDLAPGDIIAEIGGYKTGDLTACYQAVEASLGRLPLPFLIVRGSRGYLVEMP